MIAVEMQLPAHASCAPGPLLVIGNDPKSLITVGVAGTTLLHRLLTCNLGDHRR